MRSEKVGASPALHSMSPSAKRTSTWLRTSSITASRLARAIIGTRCASSSRSTSVRSRSRQVPSSTSGGLSGSAGSPLRTRAMPSACMRSTLRTNAKSRS